MNMKRHADANQHTRPSDISVGEFVLLKNTLTNKSVPIFDDTRYSVTRRIGNQVTIDDGHGHVYSYNVSQVKRAVPARCSEEIVRHPHSTSADEVNFKATRQRHPHQHAQQVIWLELDDGDDAALTDPPPMPPAVVVPPPSAVSAIISTTATSLERPIAPCTTRRQQDLRDLLGGDDVASDEHFLPPPLRPTQSRANCAPLVSNNG